MKVRRLKNRQPPLPRVTRTTHYFEGDKLVMRIMLSKRQLRLFRRGELRADRRAWKRAQRRMRGGKATTLRYGNFWLRFNELSLMPFATQVTQ